MTPTPEPVELSLDWPQFPAPPDTVTYDEASDLVSMPLDYWLMITEYAIDIDRVRALIEATR